MGNCFRPSRVHNPREDDNDKVKQGNTVQGLAYTEEDKATCRPTSHIEEDGLLSDKPTRTNTRATRTRSTNVPAAEEFFESPLEGPEEDTNRESCSTLDPSPSAKKRQGSLQRGISNCDAVFIGRSVQINTRGSRLRRSKRARGVSLEELKREAQQLRTERDEINQKYADTAKTLSLEREVRNQAYDNTLFKLKQDAQAQKARHDLQMTQMEQERNVMRMKHDNAMQDLEQREARRRCEHDQTLDDFTQRMKRLQVEYEFDQNKLEKKMRDMEDSNKEKLEELDKKELELSKKEQLFTEKEEDLKRAHEKEREEIIREHTAKMKELEKENQVLEDNYKRKVSELEKKILSLRKDSKEREDAIARECKEKEAVFKKQVDELRDKKQQMIEDYAAKTRDLAESHQRFIHRHEEKTRRQREKEDQLQVEMDGLRMELVCKEQHIRTFEEEIAKLTDEWEDAGAPRSSQVRPGVRVQETQTDTPYTLDLVTRRCELVISVHSLFQKIFIGAMLEESGIRVRITLQSSHRSLHGNVMDQSDLPNMLPFKEDFDPLINKLTMSLEEMQIKGQCSIHEEVEKELREIESFVQNFDSSHDTNCQKLVKAMCDFLARNGQVSVGL